MNEATNIAEIRPEQKSLVKQFAGKYGVDSEKLLHTLKATAFKQSGNVQVSNEQMMSLLVVANEYNLNPFTKEIYAFPANGGINPIVSVDGWMKMVNSNPQFNGMEFEDKFNEGGNLEAITCKIYRKDREHPVAVTEYMSECKRETPPWKKWPARMLRHKAAIQAARYAFSFSGIYDPDEGERIQESQPIEATEPSYETYTPDQKSYFDQLIEKQDALGMYVFMESFGHDASSPSAGVKVSLLHSFPKGKKGEYGAIVNGLKAQGQQVFDDLLTGLQAAISNMDDIGIGEAVEGLDGDTLQMLCSKLTNEENKYFEEVNA